MTDQIISRVVGNLGHITLNRPKALNALTLDMVQEMTRLMVEWAADDNIGAVIVDGAGDRAFCAGGDVILLHDSGKAGDSRAENFWREEYILWLGLTGARIDMAMSCALGVANGYVPSDQHGGLLEALGGAGLDGSDAAVANILMQFVQTPPAVDIPQGLACFSEATVPAILRALDAREDEWSMKQAKSIRRKSPLAVMATFEALRP